MVAGNYFVLFPGIPASANRGLSMGAAFPRIDRHLETKFSRFPLYYVLLHPPSWFSSLSHSCVRIDRHLETKFSRFPLYLFLLHPPSWFSSLSHSSAVLASTGILRQSAPAFRYTSFSSTPLIVLVLCPIVQLAFVSTGIWRLSFPAFPYTSSSIPLVVLAH